MKSKKPVTAAAPETKRSRRSPEQLITDLQKKIEAIKARAARQKVTKSPSLRHLNAAIKSIDKAMAASDDNVTRSALSEARSTLSACLSLNGVAAPEGAPARRPPTVGQPVTAERLLDYVLQHPGQRGEQIAVALGTSTDTLRGRAA